MKTEVRVVCVQMDVAWLDPAANMATVRRFFQRIADEGGADLVLFPELANSGYVKGPDKEFAREYLKLAEPVDGPFPRAVGQCARDYQMYVVAGFLQAHARIPATAYNSSACSRREAKSSACTKRCTFPVRSATTSTPAIR